MNNKRVRHADNGIPRNTNRTPRIGDVYETSVGVHRGEQIIIMGLKGRSVKVRSLDHGHRTLRLVKISRLVHQSTLVRAGKRVH